MHRLLAPVVIGALSLIVSPAAQASNNPPPCRTQLRIHAAVRQVAEAGHPARIVAWEAKKKLPVDDEPGQAPPVAYCTPEVEAAAPAAARIVGLLSQVVATSL